MNRDQALWLTALETAIENAADGMQSLEHDDLDSAKRIAVELQATLAKLLAD